MHHRRLPRGLLAMVVALGLLVPPLPLPGPAVALAASSQGDQGLNGGWAVDDSGSTSFVHSFSSSLGSMRAAGAGWARVVFRLGACYPTWTATGCNGRTALQAYDQVVAAAHAQNLQILGVLTAESWPGTQADWTANNAETAGGTGDNAFVQAFAEDAAAVLAQHFAGQVSAWEIWNEPNAWTSTDGAGHFWGSSYLYPSNYAWLLERSYAAIKRAQPGSDVLFGGLFAHEPFGALVPATVDGYLQRVLKRGDMPGARTPPPRGAALRVHLASACRSNEPAGADSGASYLCATYSVGLSYANWAAGAFPFDDVGQHLYLGLGSWVSSLTISSYLQDLRQAYVDYEGPTTLKRTQVTEIGWPTDQVTPQMQAANLQVGFQTLQATSFVARSYWFTTQDAPEADLYYGLVDTNGVAKPAYGAYQQYATFSTPPVPVTCSPRPPVAVAVTGAGAGRLQVTVTAGAGVLSVLQFGSATNALIDAGSLVGQPGNFSVAPGSQQTSFSVRRASPGAPTTVPLVITDACGAWPTFVGGGPTAF